jgi:hypothetical protein
MAKYIVKVDIPDPECIMLKLQLFPNITFVSCYIAPSDSPYHSFAPLSEIQERVSESDDEKFILIGDLNARFGNERTAFIEGKNFPVPTHYAPSPDPVTSTNVNARYAIGCLRDSFVLLNGLCYGSSTHKAALTFRQRSRWISELDTLFASSELLPLISDFKIHQRLDLPSDHAPVSCCIALNKLECSRNTQPLMDRAEKLGKPSTQQRIPTPKKNDKDVANRPSVSYRCTEHHPSSRPYFRRRRHHCG